MCNTGNLLNVKEKSLYNIDDFKQSYDAIKRCADAAGLNMDDAINILCDYNNVLTTEIKYLPDTHADCYNVFRIINSFVTTYCINMDTMMLFLELIHSNEK